MGVKPPVPPEPVQSKRAAWQGNPFLRKPEAPPAATKEEASKTPMPAKPEAPQPPFQVADVVNNPKKLTIDQHKVVQTITDLATEASRSGLPAQAKQGFQAHASWMVETFAKHGSLYEFARSEPTEYARWLKAAEAFRGIPPTPPAQTAPRYNRPYVGGMMQSAPALFPR
jgi:hypothetical protein